MFHLDCWDQNAVFIFIHFKFLGTLPFPVCYVPLCFKISPGKQASSVGLASNCPMDKLNYDGIMMVGAVEVSS